MKKDILNTDDQSVTDYEIRLVPNSNFANNVSRLINSTSKHVYLSFSLLFRVVSMGMGLNVVHDGQGSRWTTCKLQQELSPQSPPRCP